MSPSLLQIILFALQVSLKEAPTLAVEFQALFAKNEITDADWEALRQRIKALNYNKLVPDSDLPPTSPPV